MVYFERQHWLRCLLHTLNNILQKPKFTENQLNELADGMCPPLLGLYSPHRILFFGNYDVNVLELALQQVGKELRWVDDRRGFAALQLEDVCALIVNVRKLPWTAWTLFGGRHWFGVRCVEGIWYNLDSQLAAPQAITKQGDAAAVQKESLVEFLQYLQQQYGTANMQVFLVRPA
eukprot:jgi/Botrbrau1/18158/Bobra.53_1s0028.1